MKNKILGGDGMSQQYKETIFHFLNTRWDSLLSEKSRLNEKKDQAEIKIIDSKIKAIGNINQFVKSGIFTDSKVDKFICQNCDLSGKEMTEKWNVLAKARKDMKQKSPNTFRGQVNVLSNKIYFMLGYTASELDKLLSGTTEEDIEELISLGDNCKSLMKVHDVDISVDFDFSIESFLDEYDSKQDYRVSECKSEIEFLKMISKSNLERLALEQDKDKLAYILCRMRAPLFLSEEIGSSTYKLKAPDTYLGYEEKERKVYSKKINDMKLEMNKYFESAEASDFRFVAPDIQESTEGDPFDDEVVIPDDSNNDKSKWGIELSRTGELMLQDADNRYQALSSDEQIKLVKKVTNQSAEVAVCKSRLSEFNKYTPNEEIRNFIDSQNLFILSLVLGELDTDKSSGSKPVKEVTSEERLDLNDLDEVRISDYASVLALPDFLFDILEEYAMQYAPKSDSVNNENVISCKNYLRGFTRNGVLKFLKGSNFTEKEIKTVLQGLVDRSNSKEV